MNNEPVGKRVVVEEHRRAFDVKLTASDVIDTKLQSLLNSASLVIALIGAIQIAVLKRGGLLFWIGFVAVLIMYALLFIMITRAMGCKIFKMPISRNWDELALRYFDEDESTVLERLIADYLECNALALDALTRKAELFKRASVLFVVIILVLLVAMPFGVG